MTFSRYRWNRKGRRSRSRRAEGRRRPAGDRLYAGRRPDVRRTPVGGLDDWRRDGVVAVRAGRPLTWAIGPFDRTVGVGETAGMRRAMVVAAAVLALLAAGCGTATQPRGPGMMGGSGGAGYHFSPLACSAPAGLSGHVVTVVLGDMGMTRMMGGTAPRGARMMLRAQPSSVPAGQVSFVVQNMGWRTHELVVLPLAAASAVGARVPGADGKVDETGSLGEASASCREGSGEGISSGSVGWVTITLSPGRYELVCNLPNHYVDGMRQELDVTAG